MKIGGILIGIILLGFVLGNIVQLSLSHERESVTGKVIDSEFHKDYMTITFDNGETYNIKYGDFDFTVNSKMNVKLAKNDFWLMPNTNNVWTVYNIVKVPEGGDYFESR